MIFLENKQKNKKKQGIMYLVKSRNHSAKRHFFPHIVGMFFCGCSKIKH